jgi:hypothetical protein
MQCSTKDIVLRHLAVSGLMVMACRWVTILRARRNRKVYGWFELSDFLTNHVLVFCSLFVVTVVIMADQRRRPKTVPTRWRLTSNV